jgi:hypothetical protein
MFPYLIETTLFSHVTCPWVIPPKPGVFSLQVRSLIFVPKIIYGLYLGTDGVLYIFETIQIHFI